VRFLLQELHRRRWVCAPADESACPKATHQTISPQVRLATPA
jgi:hypothetical protein